MRFFKNTFSTITGKASGTLNHFLEAFDPLTKRKVHTILKLNGKYVIQTVIKEEREKRYFLKHYVPKNCRIYSSSLNSNDISKIMC